VRRAVMAIDTVHVVARRLCDLIFV
jgi:hypothetical protein